MMGLSIFTRLVISSLSLVIVLTGISIHLIRQLSRVNDVIHSIETKDNHLVILDRKLTDAFLSEIRYDKKFVIMKDDNLLTGFEGAKAAFETTLNEALSLTDSGEVRKTLDRVGRLHSEYLDSFEKETGVIKKGQRYEKAPYALARKRITKSIIEEMKRFGPLNDTTTREKIRHLDEAGARTSRIALMITAVACLFGIVLSIFITRSITSPLSEVEKKTKQIAKGVFDSNLKISSPPEIAELVGAFNLMCGKLKEVDMMKSDFFTLMSHELRIPLASIREGIHMLSDSLGGEVTEMQKKLLDITAKESIRMTDLVNSILDLSKMEAGMFSYAFTNADIGILINEVIMEIAPLAESKHIGIDKEIKGLPPLRMDKERILQVLRNLVGNALKFTPNGGSVRISACLSPEGARIAISDTGPGIPKEHLNVIFEKFKQTVPGDKVKGTGLGLAIVKNIIHSHGGKVWAESESGKGSTFIFVLPS